MSNISNYKDHFSTSGIAEMYNLTKTNIKSLQKIGFTATLVETTAKDKTYHIPFDSLEQAKALWEWVCKREKHVESDEDLVELYCELFTKEFIKSI